MSAAADKKVKVSRVDLRISPEQKELLEKAANLKGLSLSAYVLYHSIEAAKEDIAKVVVRVAVIFEAGLLQLIKRLINSNA